MVERNWNFKMKSCIHGNNKYLGRLTHMCTFSFIEISNVDEQQTFTLLNLWPNGRKKLVFKILT